MRGKRENSEMVAGTRPVIEAIKAGKEIDKILLVKGLRSEQFTELMRLIKERQIPYQFVPVEKLNRMHSHNHQGVIAVISEIEYLKIEDLLPGLFEKGMEPFLLCLDKVTDVRNFGAIARTAECAGINAIIVPEKGSASVNADAIKTSAGALMKIPVCRQRNLKETLDYLKDSGIRIVACTEKASSSLFEEDLTGPLCVIMGSEEEGISGEYLKRADVKVKIPMKGTIESLNVSVATGVILFESLRQRKS